MLPSLDAKTEIPDQMDTPILAKTRRSSWRPWFMPQHSRIIPVWIAIAAFFHASQLVAQVPTPACPPFSCELVDVPDATQQTEPSALNAAGDIVGTYVGQSGSRGFVLHAGSIFSFGIGSNQNISASGINAATDIVGTYLASESPYRTAGFLLHTANFTNFTNFIRIDAPGASGNSTVVTGLNDAGDIVGFYDGTFPVGKMGFVLHNGAFHDFSVSGTLDTYPIAINSAGDIVGHYDSGRPRGFLLHTADFTNFTNFTLIDIGGSRTLPRGINAAGNIVGVYYEDLFSTVHGFLVNASDLTSVTTLDVTGAPLTNALGINDPGNIVGAYYADPADRVLHGFRATRCDLTRGPCITNPTNGAHPFSAFVALSGVGAAGASIDIISDANVVATAAVNGNGTWEKVVQVGSGPHIVRVGYTGDPGSVSPPTTITNIGSFPPPLVPSSTFEKLQTADVILAVSLTSPQIELYGATYSHTALYLGGDADGTPLIAESVTASEAGTFGQVRTVSLENSTVYTDGRRVDVFRRGDFSPPERVAIVSWAAGVTVLGLSYWDIPGGLVAPFVAAAAALWDFELDQPRDDVLFGLALAAIEYEKFRTDTFICSTLVWRAYYEGTNQRLDLSQPNNIVVSPTSVLGEWVTNTGFIDHLRPFFVFPETIPLSGHLVLVP
jgi:hypothetical protein